MNAKLLLFWLALSESALAGPATLCRAEESVFFSCEIAGSRKVVSLCGGTTEGTPSWLQYRYGLAGKPELIYPNSAHGSLVKFAGHFEFHKALPLQIAEVWFRVGAHRYRIDSLTSGLPDGEPRCSADKPCVKNQLVIDGDGQRTALNCTDGAVNRLRELNGYVSEDQIDR